MPPSREMVTFDVGQSCQHSIATIRDRSGRFLPGTHWRPHKVFREKTYLIQEYVKNRRSATEIANDNGIRAESVLHWLRKHGIPRRSFSECKCVSLGRPANEIEISEYNRLLRIAFPEKYRAERIRNKGKRKRQRAERRKNDPLFVTADRERCSRWGRSNPEYFRKKYRRLKLLYPERFRDYGKKYQPKKTAYVREKRRTDINFTIACTLRGRINAAMKGKNKSASTLALLGCSVDSFKLYLESKFESNMTWDNYGRYPGWQIDHIMPCAIFDLTKPEHQRRCFHFSNMQPMWAVENMQKGSRLTSNQFQLI